MANQEVQGSSVDVHTLIDYRKTRDERVGDHLGLLGVEEAKERILTIVPTLKRKKHVLLFLSPAWRRFARFRVVIIYDKCAVNNDLVVVRYIDLSVLCPARRSSDILGYFPVEELDSR